MILLSPYKTDAYWLALSGLTLQPLTALLDMALSHFAWIFSLPHKEYQYRVIGDERIRYLPFVSDAHFVSKTRLYCPTCVRENAYYRIEWRLLWY